MIKDLLSNPSYASLVIFITQIMMLFLRTINIIYTTERKIFGAMLTNSGVAITWLLSMTIGMNSMVTGNWMPIVAFLVGGALGTYMAMKLEINYFDKNKKEEKTDLSTFVIGK